MELGVAWPLVVPLVGAARAAGATAAALRVPIVVARRRSAQRAHRVHVHLAAHSRRDGHGGHPRERDRVLSPVGRTPHRRVEERVDAVQIRLARRVEHVLARVDVRPVAHHHRGRVGEGVLLLEAPIRSRVRRGEHTDGRPPACKLSVPLVHDCAVHAPHRVVRVDLCAVAAPHQSSRATDDGARAVPPHARQRGVAPLRIELVRPERAEPEPVGRRVLHQPLRLLLGKEERHVGKQGRAGAVAAPQPEAPHRQPAGARGGVREAKAAHARATRPLLAAVAHALEELGLAATWLISGIRIPLGIGANPPLPLREGRPRPRLS
mmetsp:Transcript_40918/g.136259  ORF Transcript_40918/g.136259 Transcript_40918/m.136259 type:complete len:322 (+) Transcript_40918:250-1215(+)